METVAELRAEIGALPEAGQKAIYEAADRIREAVKKAGAAGAVGLSLVCFELAEQEEEKNESH